MSLGAISPRERDLPCPIEFMRLTLTYDGPLHSATNKDPRAAEKNDIRRKLHPQLHDVWLTHSAVEGWLQHWQSYTEEERLHRNTAIEKCSPTAWVRMGLSHW